MSGMTPRFDPPAGALSRLLELASEHAALAREGMQRTTTAERRQAILVRIEALRAERRRLIGE